MKTLVVDRDAAAARQIAEALGAADVGEVFAAGGAEEAVERVNEQNGVDVLVTDVFLEGVDGFTLSETIRAQLPALRTIFLTEYDLSEYGERIGAAVVLPKPVDVAVLAEAIGGAPAEPAFPAAPQPTEGDDPLVGATLGSYRIDAFLGEDLDGRFYRASQTTIGRTVEFHTLAPERAADPAEIERFLAAARAKANVHHAALLSVFEAGEQDGIYFYTSELRQGVSLWQIAESRLPPPSPTTLLHLLHTVAELMVHLGQGRTAHEPLHAVHVLIDARNRARLVNIATHQPMGNSAVDDMRNLAMAILPVVPETPASGSLRRLLAEMEIGGPSVRSWTALIYEVKRCAEAESAGVSRSYRLDPADQAALAEVAAARRRQRLFRRLTIGLPALLLAAAGGAAAWYFLYRPIANPALEKMVAVPAGPFVFQDKKVEVPAFAIDAYEVSIGQYADFLRWAQRNRGKVAALSPVELPPNHSFVPVGWADETVDGKVKPGYFSIAKTGGTYEGMKLTLDSPVFGVNSFDAVCYAAWKGRRLPTEIEWEKAALGPKSTKYPWGDEEKPGNANLAGPADPHSKWVAVDAMTADRSPSGAVGLAGNVSEWVLASGEGGGVTPVIRGGNWSSAKIDLHQRSLSLEPGQSSPTVGFRTAADSAP